MWFLDGSQTQNHNMRHIVTSRSKRKAPKVKFLQKNSKHKRKLKKFNYKR
jgi:hypothetical protein